MEARVDSENLNVDENSVLVLLNAGSQGGPGMPEWGGMLRIPQKLLRRGVRDMVRISDARMSGTAYGTCVLHVSPESYIGGPLALVQDGDAISLDIQNRKLDFLVPEVELERRRSEWKRQVPKDQRGYLALYRERVTPANQGCDFDFLSHVPDGRCAVD
jgi:dihydroxy-acid dehydratase